MMDYYQNYSTVTYDQAFALNSSKFIPDEKNFYGNKTPISFETSCYWSQNDSVDSLYGEVKITLVFLFKTAGFRKDV